MSDPIYLDYAATTPVDAEVARAMREALSGTFGNPAAATHVYGRRAAALVERARVQVATLIGAQPREIIFTSGTTESNNLAILGVARRNADRGRHILTSRIEHKAVLDVCRQLEREGFAVTFVEPDTHGTIDPARIEAALRPDTVLVSIQHVNNEIGTIQDTAAIGALCLAHGVFFHSDAAQGVGRLPVDVSRLEIDALSFSAHKLYGPKGIGALYVREAARPKLAPLFYGGGQERGLRPGTLPVHQIAGFGVACEIAGRVLALEAARQGDLGARLWAGLAQLRGVHLNGEAASRVGAIVNVSIEGVNGEMLIAALPDLALSTGAACDSARGEPSFVLRSLGRSTTLAESSLRFSLGRQTTAEDIDAAVRRTTEVVGFLRARSPQSRPQWEVSPGRVLTGEAGGPEREAWVRWQLVMNGNIVREALFQSLACPHTESVLAWLQDRLPGRTLPDLVPGGPLEWAQSLHIPAEKLGRLLIVEDALRACLGHD